MSYVIEFLKKKENKWKNLHNAEDWNEVAEIIRGCIYDRYELRVSHNITGLVLHYVPPVREKKDETWKKLGDVANQVICQTM